MKNYAFQFFVDCSHLCFDLFLPRFRFSLLTFITFSSYSRLSHFNPGWNSFSPGWDFSYDCNFFQLGIASWNFNPGWKSPYNQPFRVKDFFFFFTMLFLQYETWDSELCSDICNWWLKLWTLQIIANSLLNK